MNDDNDIKALVTGNITEENPSIILDGDKTYLAPNKEKHSARVYLGGKSRPYGLHPTDVFNLDHYLAATILNGLRMIMSEGHHYYDAEMELVADKLEFYIGDFHEIIDSHIDFSNDRPDTFMEDGDVRNWMDLSGRPGVQESYDKWAIVDKVKRVFIREAMEWLGHNWGSLWD